MSKEHSLSLLAPPEGAYLTQDGLDAWARDTNGAPFSQETKDELVEFLDVTDEGGLTYVCLPFCAWTYSDGIRRTFFLASRDSCRYISCKLKMTKKRRGEISCVPFLLFKVTIQASDTLAV